MVYALPIAAIDTSDYIRRNHYGEYTRHSVDACLADELDEVKHGYFPKKR